MGERIDRADLVSTAASLRAVLVAIDAGELVCSHGYRTRLQGAVTALESLAEDAGTGDTPGPEQTS